VYDVFNGDADGICALHQLRLAYPKDAVLVTGVKRDVDLLRRLPGNEGMEVTVLDISLDANVDALHPILDAGGEVTWFDHHSAGRAFPHPHLHLFWDDAPEVCTSILVDRHLQGRFREWAAAAAFGDNLPAAGRSLALGLGLGESSVRALADLGQLLNYNAYGESIEDLHVAPDMLYRALHLFADPFDFIATSPCYRLLAEGYRHDAARIEHLTPYWHSEASAVYILPPTQWARRISGIFANKLATSTDKRSYAVLTERADGSYVVSVRSGQPTERAANGLCEKFPSGGGRKAAAGINSLPAAELDNFIKAFSDYFTAGEVCVR
jgi:hypothetical protein